ncbi:unnamed protein product [Rhizoctonia solani]|uniref:Uncharacterized protein n=1 Tax=Rhizoctonia solani TaxID=456999 RepID=A0A8H3AE85_9AGAM|nr:unnamed protein product [Rhizoctonia solani]
MEILCVYFTDPDTILQFPRLRGFPLNNEVRQRLAAFFHTNYPEQTFHAWLDFIPERAERWGKLRIPDGGDSIRCAGVVDPLSPYGKRDLSFVRYTFQKDANENFPNLNIRMVEAFGYGRLNFILALALPADEDFGLDEPRLHILAHITEAKHGEGDATTKFVSFAKFGRLIILDISSVQRLVGQVRTEGTKASGEWYVIDRSLDMAEAVFQPPEQEYEED